MLGHDLLMCTELEGGEVLSISSHPALELELFKAPKLCLAFSWHHVEILFTFPLTHLLHHCQDLVFPDIMMLVYTWAEGAVFLMGRGRKEEMCSKGVARLHPGSDHPPPTL